MALYDDLIRAAQDAPEAIALEHGARRVSFGALYEQACQVAAGLAARDLPTGAAVGIMLPNLPEFVSLVYGAFFRGLVVTPMSVLLTPRELRHVVTDSALSVLFCAAPFLPVVEKALEGLAHPPEIVVLGGAAGGHTGLEAFLAGPRLACLCPVAADQHLLTLYTSGTTGPAKGVMISDGNMRAQIAMFGAVFQPKAGARALCVLPLFHAYALNALLSTAIRHRVTVVLHDRFVVEACADSLARDGIQWFAGVPTMYAMLLDHGQKHPDLAFPDLQLCLTGGAAMNREVLAGFERRFGAAIHEGYGLTETTVSLCSNAPSDGNWRIGSVGRPYPGVDCRVLDDAGQPVPQGMVGELAFRGGNVMLGYLNRPTETAVVLRNGWLLSGDLGYQDEDDFCFIVGRKKDLIIKSGYNIVPLEVENALREAAPVKDACVVGIPDPFRGERVLAAVILQPGADPATARAQIAQTLGGTLARYKHPNELWFVEAFPLGPSGKILKTTLRDLWLSKAQTEREEHDDCLAV